MGIVSAMMQVGAAIKHAVAALFKVTHSLRFDGSGDYLSRSQDVPTEPEKWTWAGWVKLSTSSTAQQNLLGAGSSGNQGHLQLINNRFGVRKFTSVEDFAAYTSSTYTDTAVWTHFVLAYDSTFGPAFADDRVKIWVNGQLENTLVNYSGGSASYPDQNETVSLNAQSVSQYISRRAHSAAYYFNGQLAEVHFIDGTAYDASYFGETRGGQWVPKEVTGVTYGNNGFHLPFDRRTEGVTLLLDGEGSSIADTSSNSGSNVSVGSSVTQSASVYKNGSKSLRFTPTSGAANSYISYTGPALSGDFTVEMWWRPDALPNADEMLWECRTVSNTTYPLLYYSGATQAGTISLYIPSTNVITSTASLTAQTWYHVALVRSSGTYELFIDGVSQGTHSNSTSINSGTQYIGRRYQAFNSNYYGLNGYIDDFRLTVGIARDIAADWTAGVYTSPLTNDIQYGSLGRDATTNGNDFTVPANTLTPDDQLIDSPNLRFATLDPSYTSGGTTTLSEANLKSVAPSGTAANCFRLSSLSYGSNDKIYFESLLNTTDGQYQGIGVGWDEQADTTGVCLLYYNTDAFTRFGVLGIDQQTGLSGLSAGTIIGVAADIGGGTVQFYKDGSTFGNQVTGATLTNISKAAIFQMNLGGATLNFGQDHTFAGTKSPLTSPFPDDDGNGEFYHQPPSGYKALATSY